MYEKFNIIALSVSDIVLFTLFLTILFTQRTKTQLKTIFLVLLSCIALWVTPLIFKILLKNTTIDPYTFECISGVGNYFAPVLFLALSNIFIKTKVRIKPHHLLFLVIPIISTILLITNESHHLLFESFSSNFNEIVYGKFYIVTIAYMYGLYLVSIARLMLYMIKNSNFFSKQSFYILIGSAIPLVINILGTFKLITISTYTTPITFSITLLLYSFAIFKFNFLKTTPIALQKIVDRMSDGYIILNEDYEIIDYNKTFLDIFTLTNPSIRGKNSFTFIDNFTNIDQKLLFVFKEKLENIKDSYDTIIFEQNISNINKTFSIEISNIFSDNTFIGILVLFKDITQHKKDMETIQNNQNMLIERERLASLGQMVGGIAHSLKTPIFSISGGIEGLSDLIKEFDESIEDPVVNNEDMHEIAKDMNVWIEKMKGHLSYMSELITTVKGQAVNLSGNDTVDFTIEELFNHITILMRHEIQRALIDFKVENNVKNDIIITGNINSLVQVLNNLISNAIQAYKGKHHEKIELKSNLDENNIVITIKDYGPGIPDYVKEKLFKEMITTKGKDGTGIGLYMSYSMIKAKFNGDITLNTSPQGTEFNVILPIEL